MLLLNFTVPGQNQNGSAGTPVGTLTTATAALLVGTAGTTATSATFAAVGRYKKAVGTLKGFRSDHDNPSTRIACTAVPTYTPAAFATKPVRVATLP